MEKAIKQSKTTLELRSAASALFPQMEQNPKYNCFFAYFIGIYLPVFLRW